MYTTPYYELRYDAKKNVIYWTYKEFWPSMAVVPELEQHFDAILKQTKNPGFHLLGDFTTMKVIPEDVQQFHAGLQQKIIQQGIHKYAVVQPASAIAGLSLNRFGKQYGQVRQMKEFDSLADAQAWLDEA